MTAIVSINRADPAAIMTFVDTFATLRFVRLVGVVRYCRRRNVIFISIARNSSMFRFSHSNVCERCAVQQDWVFLPTASSPTASPTRPN
jgi:hypothetical protein